MRPTANAGPTRGVPFAVEPQYRVMRTSWPTGREVEGLNLISEVVNREWREAAVGRVTHLYLAGIWRGAWEKPSWMG